MCMFQRIKSELSLPFHFFSSSCSSILSGTPERSPRRFMGQVLRSDWSGFRTRLLNSADDFEIFVSQSAIGENILFSGDETRRVCRRGCDLDDHSHGGEKASKH